MPPQPIPPPPSPILTTALPLTPTSFAPFGSVIANPRPDVHPSAAAASSPSLLSQLPNAALLANQGTALKYQHPARLLNLYDDHAPSGRKATAVVNMFVCAARTAASTRGAEGEEKEELFPIGILERHPFTTQSFIPLTVRPGTRYLVVVAPSLPHSSSSTSPAWPFPPADAIASSASSETPAQTTPTFSPSWRTATMQGPGLPDLTKLQAFVARGDQAVVYGAGTWHAPMIALEDEHDDGLGRVGGNSMIDFVVVQFANGVGVEDCQEVVWDNGSSGSKEKDKERQEAGGAAVTVRIVKRTKPTTTTTTRMRKEGKL